MSGCLFWHMILALLVYDSNSNTMEEQKKHALITGGTSGIGLELAKLFARDGYDLVLVARSAEELASTSRILGVSGAKVTTLAKDLFDVGNAFAVYDEVQAMGIHIDVLVNNAGQGQYGEFVDTDIRRELDIIHLNISSLVVLTKLFLKDMTGRGEGRILNVASIAGKIPGPWQAVYHATKAFVHSFSEAVREEVKDMGVSITSLLPGATDTDFFHKADMESSKIVQEGKLGDAADVAKDGYESLMAGKDKVISGMKNKMQVAMSNITPDDVAAWQMKEQQKPAEGGEQTASNS